MSTKQPQHDFLPGETVNRHGWKRGDRPGIVVAIRMVPMIEVRWLSLERRAQRHDSPA